MQLVFHGMLKDLDMGRNHPFFPYPAQQLLEGIVVLLGPFWKDCTFTTLKEWITQHYKRMATLISPNLTSLVSYPPYPSSFPSLWIFFFSLYLSFNHGWDCCWNPHGCSDKEGKDQQKDAEGEELLSEWGKHLGRTDVWILSGASSDTAWGRRKGVPREPVTASVREEEE